MSQKAIRDIIRDTVADLVKVTLIIAQVSGVDKDTDTCTVSPIDGSADLVDVKLEVIAADGDTRADVVMYPADGALCFVGLVNYDDHPDAYIIKASQYDSIVSTAAGIKLSISDGTINLDSQGLVLNGGKNGGLINIAPLVKKLNNLEKTLNGLITAFQLHSHTGNNVVTTTKAPTALDLTVKVDLEDQNVKH